MKRRNTTRIRNPVVYSRKWVSKDQYWVRRSDRNDLVCIIDVDDEEVLVQSMLDAKERWVSIDAFYNDYQYSHMRESTSVS